MNEANETLCGCNPCVGPSCTCDCQSAATPDTCACGPECPCGEAAQA